MIFLGSKKIKTSIKAIWITSFLILCFSLYAIDNTESSPNTYFYSDGRLRLFEKDDEQLVLSNNKNSNSIIKIDDEGFSLSEYDDLTQITKKTVWKSTSPTKFEIFSIEVFSYGDKSEIISSEITYPSDNKKIKKEYSSGLLIKESVYVDSKVSKTVENVYDSKDIIKTSKINVFEDNQIISSEKYEYFPGKNKTNADSDYFKDDKLFIQIRWKDNESYFQKVFFLENTIVETEFKNNVKYSESFYVDGKIVRSKQYEN